MNNRAMVLALLRIKLNYRHMYQYAAFKLVRHAKTIQNYKLLYTPWVISAFGRITVCEHKKWFSRLCILHRFFRCKLHRFFRCKLHRIWKPKKKSDPNSQFDVITSIWQVFLLSNKLKPAGSFCAILARKLEPAGIFFANFDDFGQVHSG